MTDPIRVGIDHGVAVATIDSPPLNLLGIELIQALDELGRTIENDDAVKVLVLRSGDPDFFVAHGDLASLLAVPAGGAPEPVTMPGYVHQTMERFRLMPKVTIAQIEGQARGGGAELALACDMRFASDTAVLGQPEVGLGILPGAGGTVRLARLLGRARASEIILGGRDYNGPGAAAIGWVNRSMPADEVGPFVDALAQRIARFPAGSIRAIKAVFAEVETDTTGQLVVEENTLGPLLVTSVAHDLMQRALDDGWQTRDGEPDIGARLDQLS